VFCLPFLAHDASSRGGNIQHQKRCISDAQLLTLILGEVFWSMLSQYDYSTWINCHHGILIVMKEVTVVKSVSKLRYYASLLEAIVIFIVSIFVTHYASKYAAINASNHVEDIILSNTRVYNFEVLFVHGAIMLSLFVVALCFYYRKTAPFLIKAASLFIIIRAVFVSLTHIGPYPLKLELESGLLNFITSGNDLFFSGHTGLPFLVALIFWEHKYLRYLFLASSIMFGVIVLLSHLHYSIDVFAAFFITYSIYHIAMKLFSKDYEFFTLEQDKNNTVKV